MKYTELQAKQRINITLSEAEREMLRVNIMLNRMGSPTYDCVKEFLFVRQADYNLILG